ncbi:hypothetical protein [Micromonospora auratinigra]|uniref:Secreted protein n=1 Tax=Micromonospora auratinigra TaxID=261654 RepID=A0A1A9AA07_9ACTN|nr:hypothetical protein [Micromonospora auratinigra]SBT53007.1 hypothetical protein GA0070611_5905 [Micromonospora auratinigra]
MVTFLKRKATVVALAVLTLTLAGGGIAAAAQSNPQPRPGQARTSTQPPVTAAERAAVKASKSIGIESVATSFAVIVVWNPTTGTTTVARSSAPGITVNRLGTGQFSVNFPVSVLNAVHAATLGDASDCCIPDAGEIGVAPRVLTPTAVFVQTRNSSGTPANRSFHLVVHLIS